MTAEGLRIEVSCARSVTFAMQQNDVPLVQLVRLQNGGPATAEDLTVTVSLEPELARPFTARVAAVPPGATYNLTEVALQLRPDALANAIERQRVLLKAEVRGGAAAAPLCRTEVPLELLAYNEWPGAGSLPAILAAFVLPNHPALVPVLRDAAGRLAAGTGQHGLNGYQGRDPRRARAIAEAVFQALGARGIAYVNPPASFEEHGQKVRTPEQVLQDRLGTCLDLAVLYAACLEQVGLHPLLVLAEGHALAGFWCVEQTFPEAAVEDPLPLRKRVELGDLCLVECTTLCAPSPSFTEALAEGKRHCAADSAFRHAVDVRAARRAGFRPLPVRTQAFTAADGAVADEAAAAPDAPVPPGRAVFAPPPVAAAARPPAAPAPEPEPEPEPEPQPTPAPPPEPADRLHRWKQRLLDLSLRNRLLNFRASKKTVRLLAADLGQLEEALQGGKPFQILPAPARAADDPRGERTPTEEQLRQQQQDQLKAQRLHGDFAADELERRLLEMFRAARSSLEETGANTLYLAFGLLKWFEAPGATQERRAPLLLLPVQLERTSVAGGYRLQLADDDPQLNESLLHKLRDEFEIAVPGLDALPEDERIDVAAVLDSFRRAVLDVDRWEVLPEAWLGFFSFQKHLMWLDLEERAPDLLQSPLLRHLIETPEAQFVQDGAFPEPDQLDRGDPAAVLCPKDADSSQLCAVLASVQGRSFVLEGPPGTGKSQTITNLIAQALGDGQRVLFVAEKRAALEVVQRRLAEVGLGPFCLELHSDKGSKRAVVEQLGEALAVGRQREPQAWATRAAELQQARARLNDHAQALHRERPIGESVFQVVAALVGLPEAPLVRGLRTDVDAAARAAMREAVEALAVTAGPLGVPDRHPLRGCALTDWHPALPRDLAPCLQALTDASSAAQQALAAMAPVLGLPALAAPATAASRVQWTQLIELADLLLEGPVPLELVRSADATARREAAERWLQAGRRRTALLAELAPRFRPELLAIDLSTVRASYERWGQTIWILRVFGLRRARSLLRPAAVGGRLPAPAQVLTDLATAAEAQAEGARLQGADADARATFGVRWRGADSDWDELAALLERAQRWRVLAARLDATDASVQTWQDVAGAALDGGAVAAPLRQLRQAWSALQKALQQAVSALQLGPEALPDAQAPDFAAAMQARARDLAAALPSLRDWTPWVRAASSVREQGLAPLQAAVASGEVAPDRALPCFERSFREEWLHGLLRQEPALAQFRGLDHQRRIESFRSLDRELIELSAAVVRARLSAQLPAASESSVGSSEVGILLRELKKQRRHLPVRQLLARIPNLLPRLSPCLLMSPLSVAQFLGPKVPPFDLVVFDEASQIPVWDAVGAIGRGRAAVVVGDSRQLPPTQFFQKVEAEEEAFDDDAMEELESVLDECSAAGLHRMYLRWHYRSRHESLIAFSNHHYYDNRLLTFPAAQAVDPGLGVKLVRVEGVYDRGRSQSNKVEAEALVAELVRRLRDPAAQARSYGVVTFSMAQQTLVEDLLEAARRKHPEIERHFADGQDEPVFVKNLENVQGDERDVMLFSVCYGPDAAGKVYMHFGPLNRQGGERRLNVAVTRARCELVVFSSLLAEQIDLSRTQSTGAKHLRAFLDYAARGVAAIAEAVALDPLADCESPFERAVDAALRGLGHEVHRQVGCSGYRVDLAVVDPRAKGRYLLGVECDGRSYHSAATARDRDRLRQAVLERLGWKLCRVWSTDWWQDAAGELRRLEGLIAAALQEPLAVPVPVVETPPPEAPLANLAQPEADVEAPPPEVVAEPDPEPEPEPDPDGPRAYPAPAALRGGSADDFHERRADARLLADLKAVLAAEAPVHFDLLVRRLTEVWGIGRATERVRQRVREVAGAARVTTTHDGAVLWAQGQVPADFRGFRIPEGDRGQRDAGELPPMEVCNALAFVLRQHVGLGVEDLLREGARQFGITRLGSNVRAVMESGLRLLQDRGGCVVAADGVRLP